MSRSSDTLLDSSKAESQILSLFYDSKVVLHFRMEAVLSSA